MASSALPPPPPPPPPFRDPLLSRIQLPPRDHHHPSTYKEWNEMQQQRIKEYLYVHPKSPNDKVKARRAYLPRFLINGTKEWIKAIFEQLPEHLAIMILTRLPVKSLSRFKCVSKSWCALISDQAFISKYTTFNSNRDHLLVSRLDHYSDNQVLTFLPHKAIEAHSLNTIHLKSPFIQILGPCNGVFCLFDGKDTIALWNPAIKEFLVLPRSNIAPPREQTMDTCVGFGFDSDYKVLSFRHLCKDSSGTAHAELYSLSSDTWKLIRVEAEFEPLGNLPISAFNPSINGVFSWFEMDHNADKVIFSFDMSKEVFIKTRLPDYGVPSKRVRGKLMSYKNSLAFVHDYSLGGMGIGFDVWVLAEYGVEESWIKFLTIGPYHGIDAPLGFSRSGEIFLEDSNGQLICCDLTTQEMKKLNVSGSITQGLKKLNVSWAKNTLRVFRYQESLVSVKKEQDAAGGSSFDFDPFIKFELNAKVI